MAPDKIYVAADSEFGFKNTKTAIAFSFEQKFDTVEYIRKDALLEWAKEKYNQASKNADETDERYHYGEVNAFEELIDKLNTL